MTKKMEQLGSDIEKVKKERDKCRDNCDLKTDRMSHEITMLRNEMQAGFREIAVAIAKLQAYNEKKS